MKKYIYTGTSILSFSFEDRDYSVFGSGPHDLPENSPVVITNIAHGLLSETSAINEKSKTNN